MTEQYMEMTDRTQLTNEAFAFDVRDRQGRMIGATICTYQETYEPRTDGKPYGYTMEPGTYFTVEPQATRDGKKYGAGFHSKMVNTQEEVKAEIARYLAYARKAAAKKEGK